MSQPTRILGRTGVEVSALGFGSMDLRGPPMKPPMSDPDAAMLLNAALDAGINVIDTSIDYGASEGLIGKHIAHRRDEYFLASKCGCQLELPPDAEPPYVHDFSPGHVRSGVEQSLKRLRTDHLDLVQVHLTPPPDELAAAGTIDELLRLRDEGKVRFIGTAPSTTKIAELSAHIDTGVFDVFQIPYSAVHRECEDVITEASGAGAGVLIRGGVAHGGANPHKGWGEGPPAAFRPPGLSPRERWEQARSEDVLDGMGGHEFMLRFTLSHPGMSSTIVGCDNLEHLAMNVEIAAKGPLPADLYEAAKRRFPIG
jgi:aryl-alcohol dehydrogenase-like predicted oxidoreductase